MILSWLLWSPLWPFSQILFIGSSFFTLSITFVNIFPPACKDLMRTGRANTAMQSQLVACRFERQSIPGRYIECSAKCMSFVSAWYRKHPTILHPLWWAGQEAAAKTHFLLPSWYFDIICCAPQALKICVPLSHTASWNLFILEKLRLQLRVPGAWVSHFHGKIRHIRRLNWALCSSLLWHMVLCKKGPDPSHLYFFSIWPLLRCKSINSDTFPRYLFSQGKLNHHHCYIMFIWSYHWLVTKLHPLFQVGCLLAIPKPGLSIWSVL